MTGRLSLVLQADYVIEREEKDCGKNGCAGTILITYNTPRTGIRIQLDLILHVT